MRETIDNVLGQTTAPHEIIVVDDHSTDGTLQFLKESYSQKIIAVSNSGKGPGAARNTGLQIATGKYIKYFDSDDLMSANTIEAQAKGLNNSSAGFLYSPYIYARQNEVGKWSATDNVILNYHPFPSNRPLNYWMLRGLFLAIPGILFRREVLKDAGPWPDTTVAYEDWEYLWRIGLIEPYPVHTHESVFLYRQHGEQTTSDRSDDLNRDREAVTVFEKVLSDHFREYSKSSFNTLLMQSKIYKILLKHNRDPFFSDRLNQFNRTKFDLLLFYLRLLNKIHRLKTGTNWAPYYGPESSGALIQKLTSYFN